MASSSVHSDTPPASSFTPEGVRSPAPDLGRLLKDRPTPVIVTCRRKDEGGKWEGDEEQRRTLLRSAIVAQVEYVDLEEDAGEIDLKSLRTLGARYLAFLSHAFSRELGRFRNFMSYSRQWLEEIGSEDSHGRALWALGTVVGRSGDPGRASLAESLLG